MNKDFNESDTDSLNAEEFIEKIGEHFIRAMQMIEKIAKDQGMDWEKLKEEAKDTVLEEPTFTAAQKNIFQLSRRYYKMGDDWLKSKRDILEEKEKELQQKNNLGIDIRHDLATLNDALAFIQYYLFFIHPKVKRAIDGLHDDWMLEEFPIQNDAYGSAKIAIIAIERSLGAWEIIRQEFPDLSDEFLDILSILSQILHGLKKEFPNIDQFIRPGFDEV